MAFNLLSDCFIHLQTFSDVTNSNVFLNYLILPILKDNLLRTCTVYDSFMPI